MDRVGQDIMTMMLKQLGAESIKISPAKITVVKFAIGDDLRITYMIEAREEQGSYVSRVAPYPMVLGRFFGEEDIIAYISSDLEKFRHVHESSRFPLYLEMIGNLNTLNRRIEQLFLNYFTPKCGLEAIDKGIQAANESIDRLSAVSVNLMSFDKETVERLIHTEDEEVADRIIREAQERLSKTDVNKKE